MPAKRKGRILENLALVSYIGIVMVTPILIGLFLGKWLDSKLNTQPIFLFVFIVIGVIAAFLNLFKIAIRNNKRQ